MIIETKFGPGDPVQFEWKGKTRVSRVKMIHLSVAPDKFTGTTDVLPAEDAIYNPIIYYEFGYLDRPRKDQIVIAEEKCSLPETEIIEQ